MKDKDFDPLRSRDEFKKLLHEMETRATPAANEGAAGLAPVCLPCRCGSGDQGEVPSRLS